MREFFVWELDVGKKKGFNNKKILDQDKKKTKKKGPRGKKKITLVVIGATNFELVMVSAMATTMTMLLLSPQMKSLCLICRLF